MYFSVVPLHGETQVFSVSNFASDNVLLDCCYIVEFSDLLDSGSKWYVISQQVV